MDKEGEEAKIIFESLYKAAAVWFLKLAFIKKIKPY